MIPVPPSLNLDEERAVLSAALRELHGPAAALEAWTTDAHPKRGGHRVVRYEVSARVPGAAALQRHKWIAKFYDRDDDARSVATIVRQLTASDSVTRGGAVIPRVLAYYPPRRLLLLSYEAGESLISAMAQYDGSVLPAIGRALAALHATPVTVDATTSPGAVLDDLRPKIADLCGQFPDKAAGLRHLLVRLENQVPLPPPTTSFLHGDLGSANLLWKSGRIVVLDFDDCTRGDPAMDLGSLLAQLHRLSLRKPGRLPDFGAVHRQLLESYQRVAPPDPGLPRRVSWFELATLLRKIHFLAFDTHRHPEPEALRRRQAEALRLLGQLPPRVLGGLPVLFALSEARAGKTKQKGKRSGAGNKEVSRRRRKRLRHFFSSHLNRVKGRLMLAGFFTIGTTVTSLLEPWPLKLILDHGILEKPLPERLWFLQSLLDDNTAMFLVAAAGAIVAIAVWDGVFSFFQKFITASISYQVVYALRRELFSHLQRLSLSFHARARSGDLMTRMGSDTNTLKDIISEDFLKFSSQVLTVLGMTVIMLAISWKLTLIALGTLPFLSFSLFHLYRKTKASVKRQKKQEGQVASRMTEVLGAISLVQSFAREEHEEERFDAVTATTLKESIRIARLEAAASRSSQIITAIGIAATVLVGAFEVRDGTMLPGALVLAVAYLTNFYKPIRSMAKLSTDFSKAMASAERLSEVFDIEPAIKDSPDAIEADQLKGDIVFRDVSFDYGDGHAEVKDVLRDVSFRISVGQRVALVGASGAGKSTIASLILRLYEPQAGTILIDGINIQDYRRESLRRQIGIVPQQSLLFGATVRENIAYGKPDATPEEIEAAAVAANAEEFIRELPQGYDSVIGERGATLSGGQQQRIAIARALVRNSPILILDEPMTGLDVESEAKVREALYRLMAGKTSLMITHDLQSIVDADQVLVMEDGRLVEQGTHAELLATSSRYRQLYELDVQLPSQVEATEEVSEVS